jgi:hypothetical protein
MARAEALSIVRGRSGPVDPAWLEGGGRGVAVLQGELKKALGDEIPAKVRMRRGAAELRLRLPRAAPPGAHEATVRLDGNSIPVTIEVPARARLRPYPPELEFAGKPGSEATAEFRLENRGNVAAELPRHAVTGAFASDGVATALSTAYELDTEDAEAMFHTFIRRLRDSYAGLVKMQFAGTETPIEPGELRRISATITIPTESNAKGDLRLGKGRRFHMTFRFADLRLNARITIG